MKKITMLLMSSCPYCARAESYLKQLMKEHPEYAGIEIERIDENMKPELAERYDYWYVPTFYVDGVKIHEGVPTLEKVEAVLREAIRQ